MAVLVSPGYPDAASIAVYEQMAGIATQLQVELGYFHSAIEDPCRLGPAWRARLGEGVIVPPIRETWYDAIEHFRAQRPDRFRALESEIKGATGATSANIFRLPEVAMAFAYCRWLQAWGARHVVTFHLTGFALVGYFASRLLEVPWTLILLDERCFEHPAFQLLMPVMLGAADVVVLDEVGMHTGFAERTRRLCRGATADWRGEGLRSPAAVMAPFVQTLSRTPVEKSGVGAAFAAPPGPGPAPAGRIRPFVVVGAERSGTNMIVEAVGTLDRVACAGELFNGDLAERGVVPWFDGIEVRSGELDALRRVGPSRIHARLVADAAASGMQAVGFKLMYLQGLTDLRIPRLLTAGQELPVVHVVRRNRVRRWVSDLKARQTGDWYRATVDRNEANPGPIGMDVVECLANCALIDVLEEMYEVLFADHPTLRLEYESSSADVQAAGRALAEFLSVRCPGVRIHSLPMSRGVLRRQIANFDEVRAGLAGTRWAWCVEDDADE